MKRKTRALQREIGTRELAKRASDRAFPSFPSLLSQPPLLLSNNNKVSVAARTAALVVAKVAAVDLPARAWPSLLPTLLGTMASTAAPPADSSADSASSASSTAASASLRTATLEALGYVCEEMGRRDDDVLEQDAVNAVLTAVVAGMRREERDPGVRLAATRALCNALEFAAANFESADERAYLMQVMCEGAALAPEARAREASFECLVKVAAQHYDKLEPFMRDLFAVTARAVGGETVGADGTTTASAEAADLENTEDVAKQAIEFWCTVADEEADLDDDAAAGVPGAAEGNRRFVAQAAPALVPLLLAQLTKQEEGQDADDGAWNLSMAAGTALGLVARAAKDAVVPLVVPFVTANIGRTQASPSSSSGTASDDDSWRFREAATFAFGSILEGPSPSSLAPLARQGLPLLLGATRDPSSQVRHTTAWAIGRVFEFVARGGDEFASSSAAEGGGGSLSSLLPAAALPQAVAALLGATRDEAHVADKACYAIAQLAEAAAEEAEDAAEATGSAGVVPQPSPLAPHLQEIMAGLLQLADRASGSPDAASARAAGSAYEALNDVVRASPTGNPAGAQLVSALIPVTLQKLAATLGPAAAAAAASSADARARRAELQSLLCGVLTVVLQRLAADDVGKAAAAPHADSVMEALLAVFRSADDGSIAKEGAAAASSAASSSSSSAAAAGGGAVVHEEALLAAGALSYVVGQRFAAYLPALAPVLEAGLAATRAPAVCAAAVGVLGDVARAVDDEALAPWGDVLMAALLRAVQSPETPRDVKPPILSAFGDVALALGPRFEPYLGHVLPTLAAAAQLASQAASAAAAAAASTSGSGDGSNEEDEDAAEYAAMLRSGVAEAYAGVFNGMATGDARGAAALAPAAPAALDFCAAVLGAAPSSSSADGGSAAPPPAADASARRAAIALVGDVATAVPGCGPLFAARPALGAAVAAAAAGAGGFSSSGGGSGTGEGSGDSADDARAITDAGRWALQAIQKACAA